MESPDILFIAAAIVGIIAGIITIFYEINKINRWLRINFKIGKIRLFISMPMSNLKEGYKTYFNKVDYLKKYLKEQNGKISVYFENENYPTFYDYTKGIKKLNVRKYLRRIRTIDYFIAIIPNDKLSSIYYEAGYASTYCSKSIFIVKSGNKLPGIMELKLDSDNTSNFLIVDSLEDLDNLANSILRKLQLI